MIEIEARRVTSPSWVATVNLANAIIGAGILSLPFAFRSTGLITGILYQAAFCAVCIYSVRILLISLRFAPVNSFEDLAFHALGPFGWYLFNLCALSGGFGSCVGYMIVVGDIVEPLLIEFGMPIDRSTILAVATIVVMFPLSAPPDFSSLRYASAVALAIYVAFSACLVVLALQGHVQPLEPPAALFKSDVSGLIRAIPLAAFAYNCMTTLFPIYQELENPTIGRMTGVCATALGASAVLYAAVGASGYYYFGESVQGDVLLNLASVDSPIVRLLRMAFGLSICFTYPALHFGARRAFDQMVFGSKEGNAPALRLVAESYVFVWLTFVVALYTTHIEIVLGFIGAAVVTTLVFILPTAIYLRLSPLPLAAKAPEIALLITGLVVGVLGVANVAADAFNGR